jgi:hypothetical protein
MPREMRGIHERFNKMTLSNNFGQREKGQKSAIKRICSRLLVLVGVGTMVLAVCALLFGCGSDSTPGGSVKGKNNKTASTPTGKKSQAPAMLMTGEKGASKTGVTGNIKKQPERKSVPMQGMALEEMEAKNAAAINMARSPGFKIGRLTREEMEAKNKAAAKMAQSPGLEIMPGVTLEEMKKKNAAAINMVRSPGFKMGGVTREEMEARNAAALANAPKKPPIPGQ